MQGGIREDEWTGGGIQRGGKERGLRVECRKRLVLMGQIGQERRSSKKSWLISWLWMLDGRERG